MEEPKKTTEEGVKTNAEETGNVGTQANENKDEGKKASETKAEKTYTQEEYNALDKKLKKKYEEKYKDIDLEAYKKWQDSQKTAEEKQAEKEAEYLKKDNTISDLLKENAVLKSGVNAEDVDYVVFKVSKMDGEFDENLKEFLKEKPQYLNGQASVETKATGTPVKNGSSNTNDGVLSILAEKHKDIKF